MDNRIKAFPFLTAIAIVLVAISMINATQYVIVKHTISTTVTLTEAYICPLARAGSVTPGHQWLISGTEEAGAIKIYDVKVGKWLPGTTVLFTDAFGIVNNQTLPVNMTCFASGTAADYTIIVAHVNTAKTTNGTIAATFNVDMDPDFRELWNKTRTDFAAKRGRGWWNICNWTGDAGKYIARNTTGGQKLYTATWDNDAGDKVYYYDSTDAGKVPSATDFGVREHVGTGTDLGSNYVWLEIIVGLPDDADLGDLTLTVEFRFKVWKAVGEQ